MRFTKLPTTFAEQCALLVARGMQGDPATIEQRLATTNYYRLSAYWHTFRAIDRSTNVQGEELINCKWDVVWDRYCFDRDLRLLVMDAIERIEVSIRTNLSYGLAHNFGAFGYIDNEKALPKFQYEPAKREALIARIKEETDRSREVFRKKFFEKHGDCHAYLPIWMATEVMTFHTILTIFQSTTNIVKAQVAASFGVPHSVFSSWFVMLNTARNICAHHSRLWNRHFGSSPTIPTGTSYRQWLTPTLVKHNRMFAVLTIINHCVNSVAPDINWTRRFAELLAAHKEVPLRYMGFPPNWTACPIWAGAGTRSEPAVSMETQFPEG